MAATATYADFRALYPNSPASEAAVSAWLAAVAGQIGGRCADRGTTYAALAESRRDALVGVECAAAYRRCGRSVDGMDVNGVQQFSQSVGDHNWSWGFGSGAASGDLVLDSEYRALGLSGQRIGFLGVYPE